MSNDDDDKGWNPIGLFLDGFTFVILVFTKLGQWIQKLFNFDGSDNEKSAIPEARKRVVEEKGPLVCPNCKGINLRPLSDAEKKAWSATGLVKGVNLGPYLICNEIQCENQMPFDSRNGLPYSSLAPTKWELHGLSSFGDDLKTVPISFKSQRDNYPESGEELCPKCGIGLERYVVSNQTYYICGSVNKCKAFVFVIQNMGNIRFVGIVSSQPIINLVRELQQRLRAEQITADLPVAGGDQSDTNTQEIRDGKRKKDKGTSPVVIHIHNQSGASSKQNQEKKKLLKDFVEHVIATYPNSPPTGHEPALVRWVNKQWNKTSIQKRSQEDQVMHLLKKARHNAKWINHYQPSTQLSQRILSNDSGWVTTNVVSGTSEAQSVPQETNPAQSTDTKRAGNKALNWWGVLALFAIAVVLYVMQTNNQGSTPEITSSSIPAITGLTSGDGNCWVTYEGPASQTGLQTAMLLVGFEISDTAQWGIIMQQPFVWEDAYGISPDAGTLVSLFTYFSETPDKPISFMFPVPGACPK